MMALMLSVALLMQNKTTDTTTNTSTKPDTTTTVKVDTETKSTATPQASPSKGILHITFSPTDPLAPGWFREMSTGANVLLPTYQQYVQMYLSQDKNAVKNLVTSDFVWLHPKVRKTLRSKQAVNEMQNMIRGLGLTSADDIHITFKKLFVKKEKAVAYVEESAYFLIPLDEDKGGTKMISASCTWVRIHTWRKTSLGWKLQSMETDE